MTASVQRVVPTLTEVLDVADLHPSGSAAMQSGGSAELAAMALTGGEAADDGATKLEPRWIDEVLRQSITEAVDAAVAEMRSQLLPRVEALVQQALEVQANRAESRVPPAIDWR